MFIQLYYVYMQPSGLNAEVTFYCVKCCIKMTIIHFHFVFQTIFRSHQYNISKNVNQVFLSCSSLQWLCAPAMQQQRRTLCGDAVCFLFITPLASLSGWLCVQGAMDLYYTKGMEAVGLLVLTLALFTIYVFWTVVRQQLFTQHNESVTREI